MSYDEAFLSERIDVAVDVAAAAGRLTLDYFRTGVEVELKSDDSPVTRADRESEHLIRSALRDRFPRDSILGEEHGFEDGDGDTWVVDPIDGTRSFIAGVPLYAVLIACVAGRYDGTDEIPTDRVMLGVIHIPALDETVYAGRGSGVVWNRGEAHVSDHPTVDGCRFQTSDFADLSRREPGLFAEIARRCSLSRTWGDAYGYLLVATGRSDAMVDPIVAPWDIAPLPVIIEEAGGRCTDIRGRNLLSDSIVASNGRLHDEVVSIARG